MASRVNVNITARDLTGPELARLRRSFGNLGNDMNRMIGSRTRQNFLQLRDSVNEASRTLRSMRGSIPDAEFRRLNHELRQSQATLQRGFRNVSEGQMNRLLRRLGEVDDRFQQLSQSGQIRIRIDNTALRRADARLDAWRREQERQNARIARSAARAVADADRRLAAGLRTRQRAVTVPVRPDVNRRRWTTGLLGALTQPVRMSGRILGGILSDGLGQGIIGGFRGAGPVAMAALSAIILGSISVLGAAIAGALVLAFGFGLIGLGAVFASKSDEIQRNWKSATKNMGEDMKRAAEPLVPVMHKAIHQLEGVIEQLAPKLKKFFSDSAPQITGFLGSLEEGFKKFGSRAWEPLSEAFNVFLLAFGPEFENFMAGFGDSMGALARTVTEHSGEIAIALRMVLGLITTMIDIINFFAVAWSEGLAMAHTSVGMFLLALSMMVEKGLEAFGLLLEGMAAFSEHIPGMGEGLKVASEEFNTWKEGVVGDLKDAATEALNWSDTMDAANKTRKLKVDIASWMAQLTTAKEKLKSVPKSKQSKIMGDISDLSRKIGMAYMHLAAINGTTATTYIKTVYTRAERGGHPTQRRATGGISAAATGGARSNLTMVGEQGPELVDLAPGSHVRSNPDTRRLLGSDSGGGSQFVFKSSGRRVDDLLLEILREAIHQRGGDPVVVLGG
jgi:hypothetical protein